MISSAIKPYPIESVADKPIEDSLAQALLASVALYHDQLRGKRLWLACSGGRDSLALAALCLQLYRQGKLAFLPQLLHVDHGLQADSALWANHVAKWAQVQRLPCTILTVVVAGTDEQAARQARYQAMLNHINQGDVLILAHHADDQAETLLMRLIQGAGVKGLAAMQPWRVQLQVSKHNELWRPWLSVRRTAITNYAQRLQLPYIDDPTNVHGDNVRSSLRREVMPLLASYNTNVIENIARSAQLLSEAQQTLDAQAQQDLAFVAIMSLDFANAQRVLAIDRLQSLPGYRQKQLLHYWLAQDEPLPPSKQLVDEVYALTQRQDNDHQTQLDWYANHQNYSVYRYRQQLYRLSHAWLNWLALPVVEQEHVLPLNLHEVLNHSLPNSLSNSLSDKSLLNIDIRIDNDRGYLWQLQVNLAEISDDQYQAFFDNNTSYNLKKASLRIAILDRTQKIKTTAMGRAQAGKKLYQTLAIPVWLRESLVVVSAVVEGVTVTTHNIDDSETVKIEVPLLLLSPFESWPLTDEASTRCISKYLDFLSKVCWSHLQVE